MAACDARNAAREMLSMSEQHQRARQRIVFVLIEPSANRTRDGGSNRFWMTVS
jgi:hypothetical protein